MTEIPIEIAQRRLGDLAISLGTSVPIATILSDPIGEKQRPNHLLSSGFVLAIDLRTIIRNILESIPSKDKPLLTESILLELVKDEITTIETIIRDSYPDKVKLKVFYSFIKDIDLYYPKAILKTETDKGLWESLLTKFVVNELMSYPDIVYSKQIVSREELANESENLIILTHAIIQLPFIKGVWWLLSSYTGKIYPISSMYEKIKSDKTLVPFTPTTLSIYGDGYFFKPHPKSVKALFEKEFTERGLTICSDEGQVDDLFENETLDMLTTPLKSE